MKIFAFFLFLAAALSLSEQTPASLDNGGELLVPTVSVGDEEPVERLNGDSILREIDSNPPPSDYVCISGHGYYKLEQQWVTFYDAVRHCQRSRSHLAIINSRLEAISLANYIRKTVKPTQPWPRIGFGDFFERGDFVTIFDKPLNATGYEMWYPGQPNLQYERNCGCMNTEGLLGTQCCDCNIWFLCEFDGNTGNC